MACNLRRSAKLQGLPPLSRIYIIIMLDLFCTQRDVDMD